jgi:hypothetical protein
MSNITNLALAMDTSYNYKKDSKHISKINYSDYGNNQFLTQTKRAMILRENILASGMEPEDIQIASDVAKIVLRR